MTVPDLLGYHMGDLVNAYARPRAVTVEVEVTGDTNSEFASRVESFLSAFAPADDEAAFNFKLPGQVEKRINCRVMRRSAAQRDRVSEGRLMTFLVQLLATDPAILAAASVSTAFEGSIASEGVTYDVTYDKSYGAGGVGSGTEVLNNGGWKTWPVFYIAGPQTGAFTNPVIENMGTGDKIELTANGGVSITSGQTIVIETHPQRRSVVFSTGASRYGKLTADSTFFPLEPGSNVIRVNGGGTSTGVVTTCVARDAWI